MRISVVGRHMEIPEDFKQYALEKAAKLPRFYDRVQMIEVIIDRESDHAAVEIIVQAAGTHNLVAKEVGPDARACIDLLVDKLERQLTRQKEKLRNRKHIAKPEPFQES